MKKLNKKKGFTIVELVIVIAVIAILAAVLIPTFSGVIEKANANAALQACRNELVLVKADLAEKGADVPEGAIFISGNYAYEHTEGELKLTTKPEQYKSYTDKKVKVVNLLTIEKATQTDAVCCEGNHVHAISVTLPTGFTFGKGSYEIYKDGKLVAKESWTTDISRGTIYFNIAACKAELVTREPANFGNLQTDATKDVEGIPAGTYTYKIVANGTTYEGSFTIA